MQLNKSNLAKLKADVERFLGNSAQKIDPISKELGPDWAREVAIQIQLIKKVEKRFPTWVKNACLFHPVGIQQATSELTASLKSNYSGDCFLDLCCGQGVDSNYFANSFKSGISLEPNEDRFHLAQFNFELLNCLHVEIIQIKAEDFLKKLPNDKIFDLIYADPSRRNETGKRTFLLEKSEPDIGKLLPEILAHTKMFLLKCSPLTDITAARRLPFVSKIIVLGNGWECKEVLLEFRPFFTGEIEVEARFHFQGKNQTVSQQPSKPEIQIQIPTSGFIAEAEPSIYKAGLAESFFAHQKGKMNHPSGYFFSDGLLDDNFPARIFRILKTLPFKPATWKKELNLLGIKNIHFSRRNLDIPLNQIIKESKMKEGGNHFLLMTSFPEKKRAAFLCERIR